jgi:hypothetical protein
MKVTDIDGQMMELNAYHIKQQELQLVGLTMIDLSYILPDMKTIKYNNKTIKLPFNGADYGGDDALTPVQIQNRFTGQSTTMPTFAAAVYDVIIGSEMIATQEDKHLGYGTSKQWDNVRKGLDWFRRHFAEQYMVVLD